MYSNSEVVEMIDFVENGWLDPSQRAEFSKYGLSDQRRGRAMEMVRSN